MENSKITGEKEELIQTVCELAINCKNADQFLKYLNLIIYLFSMHISYIYIYIYILHTCKGKAVPLQARRGSEGSRKLSFPDFVTTAQNGGRLSALRTGRLYTQEILLVLISVRG